MINQELPIQLIRKIIINQGLIKDDRIMIYNGKYKIPPGDNLFIYLEYKDGKIISNRRSNDVDTGVFQDQQDLNVRENIAIGIFSKNLEALMAKEAIVMALASTYSEQLQAANSFKIFPYAPIENLSELEGDAQLYRFDISLSIFAWYRKTTPAEYFNIVRVQTLLNVADTTMENEFIQPTSLPIL